VRKFALSSGAYQRYELVRAIRHTALAGYTGIEILADRPHAYPIDLNDEARATVRSALAKHRLAVSNINAEPMEALRDKMRPSWIEPDPVLSGERLMHTLDAGQLANDLGAPHLSTMPAGMLQEEMTPEQALEQFVAGLKRLAVEGAKKAKKKRPCPPVLFGARHGFLVETAEQILDVLERVGSDRIGATLNTGRLRSAGQDVGEAIRRLRGQLRHVHLEDCSRHGDGKIVVPGTGLVDFAAVFAALDDIGYDGWLTVNLAGADVHPDVAAKQALQYLGQFDA
jgi:sugar phosphate isomerase/epimerase